MTRLLGYLPITILNPRRYDWDSTWKERKSDPRFSEQVQWELDGQQRADVVAIYFYPGTEAPISLLELGLNAHAGKAVVCCAEEFYCRGNIEIVCDRLGITLVDTFDKLVEKVIERVHEHVHGGTMDEDGATLP